MILPCGLCAKAVVSYCNRNYDDDVGASNDDMMDDAFRKHQVKMMTKGNYLCLNTLPESELKEFKTCKLVC